MSKESTSSGCGGGGGSGGSDEGGGGGSGDRGRVYCVGVDVGSTSVRAALVCVDGRILKTHTHPITVSNPIKDYYEQDSEEIWEAVCVCVKAVTSGVKDKREVRGLGFDATCSLVVLGRDFRPITVSPATGEDRFNVIMWMDHRATKETDQINANPHRVLECVGGKLSPEMQTPKLLWLKKHMSNTWNKAGHFFDLPDYLTFRATGSLSRSLCSVVCKWTYMYGASESEGQSEGWDEHYFNVIGLEDLAKENWSRIGQHVQGPGEACGSLSTAAAHSLGLTTHTTVATSIIDAHAGCLAMCMAGLEAGRSVTERLGLICGTSTCHMALNTRPIRVPGVWGPYGGVVLPHTYLTEGGISASGALIDHIINTHPAAAALAGGDRSSIFKKLEEILEQERKSEGLSSSSLLTPHLHVYPDYHGNRSPLADPTMTGMVSGLTLDGSEKSLAFMYLAAIQGLAYSTRQLLTHIMACGQTIIRDVVVCGGLCASQTYIQTHADALGLDVLVPERSNSVLLGSAMLGAAASGCHGGLEEAAAAMGGPVRRYHPNKELKEFHDRKFEVFLKMQNDQRKYREIMNVKCDE